MPDFRLEWMPEGDAGVPVLKLSGPFTVGGVSDFQIAVRERRPGFTIIDLTEVIYMDSTALGALLGMHVSCQRERRGYALVGVPSRVQTLFRMAGVASVLITADSIEAARAAGEKRA